MIAENLFHKKFTNIYCAPKSFLTMAKAIKLEKVKLAQVS